MNGTDLKAINNSGAMFLLIYSLLLLSFTLMIWYAFYKIPDNYGLISKRTKHLSLKSKELTDTYVENLINVSKEDHLIVSSPRTSINMERPRYMTDINNLSQLKKSSSSNMEDYSKSTSALFKPQIQ